MTIQCDAAAAITELYKAHCVMTSRLLRRVIERKRDRAERLGIDEKYEGLQLILDDSLAFELFHQNVFIRFIEDTLEATELNLLELIVKFLQYLADNPDVLAAIIKFILSLIAVRKERFEA